MLVLLARHAERADFAENGDFSSTWFEAHADDRPWDPPLSAAGKQQASELANLVKATLQEHGMLTTALPIFTSPFLRCFHTAAIVREALARLDGQPPPLVVDSGLGEVLHPELYDGRTAARQDFVLGAEKLAAMYGTTATAASPPLGAATYPENDVKFTARLEEVAHSLVRLSFRDDAPAAMLLVVHGGVLLTLLGTLAAACGAHNPIMPHLGYASLTSISILPGGEHGSMTLVVHRKAQLPLLVTPDLSGFAKSEPLWRSEVLPQIAVRKLEKGGVLSILELGSGEGASAAWLLIHCCDDSSQSRLICVDHFGHLRTSEGFRCTNRFSFNMRLTALWPRVELLVDDTVAALGRLLAQRRPWDLVHLDASSAACDVLLEAMLAWKGLCCNGIMILNGYEWQEHPDDSPLHPRPGIDAFLQLHGHELQVLHKKEQVIVRKTVKPRFTQ